MAGDREQRPGIDANVLNGLIHANAPSEVIDKARLQFEQNDNRDCEVWEENWRSVMFFLDISTQWVIAPMGGYVGLNYVAIESAMNMSHIRKVIRKPLFSDLVLIEQTMLPILNKSK